MKTRCWRLVTPPVSPVRPVARTYPDTPPMHLLSQPGRNTPRGPEPAVRTDPTVVCRALGPAGGNGALGLPRSR